MRHAAGRLTDRWPRVARYDRIAYEAAAKTLSHEVDTNKLSAAENRDGCYLHKTDRRDPSAEWIWRINTLLMKVEEAFRTMKSTPPEMPIFYQGASAGIRPNVIPSQEGIQGARWRMGRSWRHCERICPCQFDHASFCHFERSEKSCPHKKDFSVVRLLRNDMEDAACHLVRALIRRHSHGAAVGYYAPPRGSGAQRRMRCLGRAGAWPPLA